MFRDGGAAVDMSGERVKITGCCIDEKTHKVTFNYNDKRKGLSAISNLPLCPICNSTVKINEIELREGG